MPKRRQPERAEQAAGVKLLRALGAAVYTLGTTRRRGDHPGTMQSEGLPDVLAFLPPKRSDQRVTLLIWECKAKGGRLRPAQATFRDQCLAAGLWHVTGDCDALIASLIQAGYLRAEQVPHYRVTQIRRGL